MDFNQIFPVNFPNNLYELKTNPKTDYIGTKKNLAIPKVMSPNLKANHLQILSYDYLLYFPNKKIIKFIFLILIQSTAHLGILPPSYPRTFLGFHCQHTNQGTLNPSLIGGA